MDIRSFIQEAPGLVWGFLEQYGYYILALIILIWIAKPKVEAKLDEYQRKQSLKEAKDPSRVRTLDEKRKQSVERLQAELEKAKEKKAKEEAEKESKDKKPAQAPLRSSPYPGPSSPLNPQVRQPHRFGGMRNRPKRG